MRAPPVNDRVSLQKHPRVLNSDSTFTCLLGAADTEISSLWQTTSIQTHSFLAYLSSTSGWSQSKPTSLGCRGMAEHFTVWVYQFKSSFSSAPQRDPHFMEPRAPASRDAWPDSTACSHLSSLQGQGGALTCQLCLLS